jgi:hypothetical protein
MVEDYLSLITTTQLRVLAPPIMFALSPSFRLPRSGLVQYLFRDMAPKRPLNGALSFDRRA